MRTGRARTVPGAPRTPPSGQCVPVCVCLCTCVGCPCGEWGSRAHLGGACLCVRVSSGFVWLCVCIHGCDLYASACLYSPGAALGICATLCVPLWMCVCVYVALPPSLRDSHPFVLPALLGLQVPALGTSQLGTGEGELWLDSLPRGPGQGQPR